MKIDIAQRLHPFSHVPGVRLILPKTILELQAFPTRLRIGKQEVLFHVKGPVKGFTVEQDLEKGEVCIYSHQYRYLIRRVEGGVEIFESKTKKTQIFPFNHLPVNLPEERLSLGMHKAQDWDMVKRRGDLKEILPAWLALGNMTPVIDEERRGGTLTLLNADNLLNLFNAGFYDILCPRINDDQYQGLCPETNESISPFPLLTEGAKLIRSLFFKEEGDTLYFLPNLPSDFHSGRFKSPLVDMEWSKKQIRRLILRHTGTKTLIFQKFIKRFRLRHSPKEKGQIIVAPATLTLEPGRPLFLDRFEK